MGDFAASVLAPVVESGVKYVVGVIKRQFIYLCCFVSNIASLRDEAQNLDDVANEMQARVNAANDNVQEIKPEIVSWLRATSDIKERTTKLLNEVPVVENGCLARFSLSRSAVKTSEAMTLHREKCKLFGDDISMAPSSAASKQTPLGTTYEFKSRKQIEQDIMIALRGDDEINMIGICGMGGLGKTTMAKRIMNKVLEDGIFQEVVIAVVSQTVDELKIQVEIGGSLGLKDLEKESEQARVQKLYERLTSSTKRILLVLDDVWKIMKLKELGIPCGGDSKGCVILITSRNSDALKAMGVKQVFGLKELSEEDAWFLFKENAGACVEDTELNSVAKQVVSKCKGLPIAIEIVGASLKDERSKSVWKDALKHLKKPNPKNTPDFIADVYKPLIVSYDRLDNDEVKSLFLVCCLFPEDDIIPLERLVVFCMGLRIFEDTRSVGDVRDRVYALVKRLKTRSLLLDIKDEDFVSMHDVVRDIGIFTRKLKEKSGGTWISSNELPVGEETSTEIPSLNLRLLLSKNDKIKIENTFCEGMRELYVLGIENHSWTSLPVLPKSLKTIRTLVLDWCEDLETLSGVGGLVNLEILICRFCYEIKELPHEIGGLKHLKVLDLTRCIGLQNIAPGILSSLVELEELKMLDSFDHWERYDGRDENRCAGLGELESLTKLTCLEIRIAHSALVSQEIKLSTNIKRFHIRFDYHLLPKSCERYSNILGLRLSRGACIGHWVEKLLKISEYLCISEMREGGNILELAKANTNLRYLKLDNCESVRNIICDDLFQVQCLEVLEISSLPQLQEISRGPISFNSAIFQNIKTIRFENLPALEVMWRTDDDDERSYSYANSNTSLFPHIECLELSRLPLLQEVWNIGPVSPNSFQSLKKIHIKDLPELKQLGKSFASTSVSLPQLRSLEIQGCGMMEQLFQSSEKKEGGDIDQHYYHLFCQPQKVSFGSFLKNLVMDRNPFCRHLHDIHAFSFNRLKELCISKCVGNSSLFTPQIARNMINLRELSIVDCDEMIRVIDDDEDDKAVGGGRLFPQLLEIELRNLSKLVKLCDADHVQLPPLKRVTIMGCPNMITPLLPTTLHSGFLKTDLDNYLHAPFKEENHEFLHQIPLFSFHGLRALRIQEYEGGMCIFSSSVARNLVDLRSLHIYDCKEMVKVIQVVEEDATLLFPNLEELYLSSGYKLEKFGEWKHEVELPSLKRLDIFNCPKMAKLTLGSISTPHLKSVQIDYIEYIVDASSDLNAILLQSYLTRQMEESMEMEMEMEMEKWMETKMEMETK